MPQKRDINRREILKAAAGLVAFPYVVSSSALGADGGVAPSNRIVHGAIGLGSRGTGVMRGFLGRGEVQIVAICDIDKSHRDRARQTVDDPIDEISIRPSARR